jgi:hypothetical protein
MQAYAAANARAARATAARPAPAAGRLAAAARPRAAARRAAVQARAEISYVMIKPDGVQRGLVGDIIGRFERKGEDSRRGWGDLWFKTARVLVRPPPPTPPPRRPRAHALQKSPREEKHTQPHHKTK